jgi:hypothetical protein
VSDPNRASDALDAIAPRHEPVNVSDVIRKASTPAPERVTRPANAAAVDRVAKRTTRPAEG